LILPHMSEGGHAICTNPKCKTRMAKSNATLDVNERLHKALMFTNTTKVFIANGGIVAECICGNKYDVNGLLGIGIYFEKNK